MINPITPIRPMDVGNFITAIESVKPIGQYANRVQEETQGAGGVTFADMLKQLIDNANVTSAQSRANANNLSWGVTDTALHNIEIDALRADLALRTLTSVRNKVLEAYQEVMRITV
jgi:flagellar hook-basal body complex protein FliE